MLSNRRIVVAVAVAAAVASSFSSFASAGAGHTVSRQLALAPAPALEVFVSMAPQRVLDSRVPLATATAGPLSGGTEIDLPLTSPAPNRPSAPLPANATSAVLNVTIADATEKAFLTVWPTGQPRPLASTNNAEPGLVSPNETVTRLGTGGSISMYLQQGSANVIVDLVGYFVPASPAYAFGTDDSAISLAPFASTSLTGEFGYGPEQVVFSVPPLPVGDYLLDASVSFSKLPDGAGGSSGATNDMHPQCWWSTNPARRFTGFSYAFAPDNSYPVSVSLNGRIQGADTADLICRYGLTDADDTTGTVRDLPLDVGAISINITTVSLAATN